MGLFLAVKSLILLIERPSPWPIDVDRRSSNFAADPPRSYFSGLGDRISGRLPTSARYERPSTPTECSGSTREYYRPCDQERQNQIKASALPIDQIYVDQNGVDWREHVLRAAGLEGSIPDHLLLEKLYEHFRIRSPNPAMKPDIQFQVLHRVECADEEARTTFLDKPWMTSDASKGSHLRGSRKISNLELHIERQTALSFLVYRDYVCCEEEYSSDTTSDHSEHEANISQETSPDPSEESVYIVSETFRGALQELVADHPLRREHWPDFRRPLEFRAPYLWLYHDRSYIAEKTKTLSTEYQKHIQLLLKYVDESFGDKYAAVENLFSRGLVSNTYLEYLFVSRTYWHSCIQYSRINDAKSSPSHPVTLSLNEKMVLMITFEHISSSPGLPDRGN